jgi:hypothetical protein
MEPTPTTNLNPGARMTLELEWKTFKEELPRLLESGERGKFALVRGNVVAGSYATRDEALSAGYERFGIDPFLVQEITDEMKPKYFSHNIKPCR